MRADAVDTVHFVADALGSTVALTNPAGAAATTYTYEPFGRTDASGTLGPNPFRFTGRENDGTGLYYYRARYYHPILHRFIGEDKINRRGPMNLYTYVDSVGKVPVTNLYEYARNNPLAFVDPMGLQWQPQPGTPGPMLLKPIESPLLRAAAIGGIISTGLVQVGVGATTVAVGVASIPETGPAGVIVAGAGVTVTATGVAQIAGGIVLIPYLFPGSPPPGGISATACPEDFPPIPLTAAP